MFGLGIQDCGIQELMGPVADRTIEHLGISDTMIIKLRRLLLKTLKDFEEGANSLPGLDPRAIACARAASCCRRDEPSPTASTISCKIKEPAFAK